MDIGIIKMSEDRLTGVNFPFYQDLNGIYCENTMGGGGHALASPVWLIRLSMNRLLNTDTSEEGEASRVDP